MEFPDLEQNFHQRYKDEGLIVIGVSGGDLFGGDDVDRIEEFLAQTGATFDVGFDLTGSYNSYQRGPALAPFPLQVVLDRNGRIQYISREYDPTALDAVVTRTLAQ